MTEMQYCMFMTVFIKCSERDLLLFLYMRNEYVLLSSVCLAELLFLHTQHWHTKSGVAASSVFESQYAIWVHSHVGI